MSESVEYRDGVFVATGPTAAVGHDPTGGPATGTALMVRPGDGLAPVDAPGPLVSADVPPAGPTPPGAVPAPRRRWGPSDRRGHHRRLPDRRHGPRGRRLRRCVRRGLAARRRARVGRALGAAAATSAAATSVAFTLSATRATSSSTTTLVTGSGAVDLAHRTGRLTATVPVDSPATSAAATTRSTSSPTARPSTSARPPLSSLTGGTTWLKADLPKGAVVARPVVAGRAVQPVAADRPAVVGRRPGHDGGQRRPPRHPDHRVPDHGDPVRAGLAGRHRDRSGSAVGAQVAKVLQQLGSTSVPVTAWVGTDGYLRQISASIDLSRATLGGVASRPDRRRARRHRSRRGPRASPRRPPR